MRKYPFGRPIRLCAALDLSDDERLLLDLMDGSKPSRCLDCPNEVTTDETARALFAVKDKTPLLAIRVEIETVALRESAQVGARRGLPGQSLLTPRFGGDLVGDRHEGALKLKSRNFH